LCVNLTEGSAGTIPAMSPIKLIVFDIAGTIIEDHGEVIRAFTKALTGNGIPFAKDELKSWVGASKREVIRHFITQADPGGQVEQRVETSYLTFRAELERCYAEKLVPIGGALETFRWCRDRGILLATTTGFYREISDLVLNQTGWRDFFAANISSSDVREGRPAPYMIFRAMEATGVKNVKEVVTVGDTPLDLQSGSNAGVAGVVGVLTGAHGRETLEREPHTHIINSVAELPEILAREF
jgi:phosphonatase-like hydrolase